MHINHLVYFFKKMHFSYTVLQHHPIQCINYIMLCGNKLT